MEGHFDPAATLDSDAFGTTWCHFNFNLYSNWVEKCFNDFL